MRFVVLFASLLVFSCSGRENRGTLDGNTGTGKPAEITFQKTTHDFGQVTQGEVLEYTFVFTNTGGSDLIIYSASASCGCTVPDYEKQPVPPGKQGKVKIVFNTRGFRGAQSKSISLFTNSSEPATVLFVRARIQV